VSTFVNDTQAAAASHWPAPKAAEFLVECVLVATIDRLCFHPAKIEMIKRWRGRGGGRRLTKRACVMTSQTC
jgi:hypothetical protein